METIFHSLELKIRFKGRESYTSCVSLELLAMPTSVTVCLAAHPDLITISPDAVVKALLIKSARYPPHPEQARPQKLNLIPDDDALQFQTIDAVLSR